jgi:hypothetical protein
MKKVSTVAVKQIRNISEQKLTIGLDLGDRSSWVLRVGRSGQRRTGGQRGRTLTSVARDVRTTAIGENDSKKHGDLSPCSHVLPRATDSRPIMPVDVRCYPLLSVDNKEGFPHHAAKIEQRIPQLTPLPRRELIGAHARGGICLPKPQTGTTQRN